MERRIVVLHQALRFYQRQFNWRQPYNTAAAAAAGYINYKAGIKKDKTSISLIEYKKRTKSVLLSDKVSISLPQHYKHGKVIKRI